MITLTNSVSIGGSDYSDYVVSIERHHSICEPMATGSVVISHAAAWPTVYDEIVIYELGTKVFTGFVTNVRKGRMPVEFVVEFADPIVKLSDYWITDLHESTGESAEYWIGYFCDLAGVSYQFDVTYNNVVPDEYEFQYNSALTIIRELIVVGGFYMYCDADGLLHFNQQNIGTGPSISTGDNLLQFSRERTITPTRNQAIVFGKYPISALATVTVPELGSATKTAVIATPYVESESYAQDLATSMLEHFQNIGDVKRVTVLGDPDFSVGQSISLTESWSGVNTSSLITSMDTFMSNDGYTMDITLDEFCPFIWGYFREIIAIILYAGTDGQGVWRSDNLGVTWSGISGNIPSGEARYVRGITASGNVVWAATQSGVYYTSVGGTNWSNKTPTLPSGITLTDWTDVEIDPSDVNTVYVLMDALPSGGVYLHKTENNGSSWNNVRVE